MADAASSALSVRACCAAAARYSLHAKPRIFAVFVEAHEPVGIQAFGPELAVQGFDVGVVGRLAGSAEVQRHAAGKGPEVELLMNSGLLRGKWSWDIPPHER